MNTPSVDTFLDALAHPQRPLIDRLRSLIRKAEPALAEGIKWNAPSYALAGNDILTFNFRNYGSVALIFHTGPKGKDTHTGAHPFEDATGRITWLADKRFVLKFADDAALTDQQSLLHDSVRRWAALARDHGW